MVTFNADILIAPEGQAKGCNPRISKVGQWCPRASERIDTIPRSQWSALIPKITVAHHVGQVLSQGSVGSCAGESSVQSLMIDRIKRGQKHIYLNPWFAYHTTSGGVDRGSSIDENLRFLREYGCCPESIWPRSKGWKATPSREAYIAAKQFRIQEFYDVVTLEELVSCILHGFPVVFGYSGHAICGVAMASVDRVVYVNSWGTRWGDNGFGTIALSRIYRPYGMFAVRTSSFLGA